MSAKRKLQVIHLIRDQIGVEAALVVLASIEVAQRKWDAGDTAKYGEITRDHLFNKGEFIEE